MGRIVNIHARQILDSRGNPTVEAEVYTDLGVMGRAMVTFWESINWKI